MQIAFHYAIDLMFMFGIAMLGRSIKRNSLVISQSIFGAFTIGFGGIEFKKGFSQEAVSYLGSLCIVGGVLAGIVYAGILSIDLMLAN